MMELGYLCIHRHPFLHHVNIFGQSHRAFAITKPREAWPGQPNPGQGRLPAVETNALTALYLCAEPADVQKEISGRIRSIAMTPFSGHQAWATTWPSYLMPKALSWAVWACILLRQAVEAQLLAGWASSPKSQLGLDTPTPQNFFQ